jgi:hypothetical protein
MVAWGFFDRSRRLAIVHKEVKSWRERGSELDKIKARLESCIFKFTSWLNGLFLGWWSQFFWKGKPRPIQVSNVASWLTNFSSVSSSITNAQLC